MERRSEVEALFLLGILMLLLLELAQSLLAHGRHSEPLRCALRFGRGRVY